MARLIALSIMIVLGSSPVAYACANNEAGTPKKPEKIEFLMALSIEGPDAAKNRCVGSSTKIYTSYKLRGPIDEPALVAQIATTISDKSIDIAGIAGVVYIKSPTADSAPDFVEQLIYLHANWPGQLYVDEEMSIVSVEEVRWGKSCKTSNIAFDGTNFTAGDQCRITINWFRDSDS